MKKLFLICLMTIIATMVKAQAYGLTVSDLLKIFQTEEDAKSILIQKGFLKGSGNLWMYNVQPTMRQSIYTKEDSQIRYLFFGGQNFFVAAPNMTIKALFFSFDTKHLGYYLNWFGAIGFSGLPATYSLHISDEDPDGKFTTATLKLTSTELPGIEVSFQIWKDRCQLTMMNKL